VVLAVCIVAVVTFAAVTHTLGGEGDLHEALEAIGLALIGICIVGRAWCSLYIGGRKKAEIVDRGPYSISRNPLYVFSFIGAFGIGAQTGSVIVGAAFAIGAITVFFRTVGREEAWLREAFDEPYVAYCDRTPRFWPDFRKWRDVEELSVRPVFFLRTLRDGLTLLLAVPVMEAIERLQDTGLLRLHINLF